MLKFSKPNANNLLLPLHLLFSISSLSLSSSLSSLSLLLPIFLSLTLTISCSTKLKENSNNTPAKPATKAIEDHQTSTESPQQKNSKDQKYQDKTLVQNGSQTHTTDKSPTESLNTQTSDDNDLQPSSKPQPTIDFDNITQETDQQADNIAKDNEDEDNVIVNQQLNSDSAIITDDLDIPSQAFQSDSLQDSSDLSSTDEKYRLLVVGIHQTEKLPSDGENTQKQLYTLQVCVDSDQDICSDVFVDQDDQTINFSYQQLALAQQKLSENTKSPHSTLEDLVNKSGISNLTNPHQEVKFVGEFFTAASGAAIATTAALNQVYKNTAKFDYHLTLAEKLYSHISKHKEVLKHIPKNSYRYAAISKAIELHTFTINSYYDNVLSMVYSMSTNFTMLGDGEEIFKKTNELFLDAMSKFLAHLNEKRLSFYSELRAIGEKKPSKFKIRSS